MIESVVVLVVLMLVPVLAVILSYNRFVAQRNLVQESWTQIDVELKRRHDLIPNLIATVKGYAAHEAGTLERVMAARNGAVNLEGTGPSATRQAAEQALGKAVGGLLAVAEQYPDLKANVNFLELQRELATTEDRIAAGRRFFNGNVRAYRTRLQAFPSNLIAKLFGFTETDAIYFELDDPAQREAVTVQF